jgi:hypothetical protein
MSFEAFQYTGELLFNDLWLRPDLPVVKEVFDQRPK